MTKVKNETKDKNKNVLKDNNYVQRTINLAMHRNYNLQMLFSYELTHNNILYDANGNLKKETTKSQLVTELESRCKTEDVFDHMVTHAVIVDVMLHLRSIQDWSNINTFKDLAEKFCEKVKNYSKNSVSRIDFVFDL